MSDPSTNGAVEIEPGIWSVLIEGRSYELRIAGETASYRGVEFSLDNAIQGASAKSGGGTAKLKAPMPGKVIRVLASNGDIVEAGQGVLVVEAMKMQNEMKAPRAGTVSGLRSQPGDAVSAGELLALIE
jgi:biotin carboxyl carrier protein